MNILLLRINQVYSKKVAGKEATVRGFGILKLRHRSETEIEMTMYLFFAPKSFCDVNL